MEPADGVIDVEFVRNKICSALVKSAFSTRNYLPLDQLCEILSPFVVHQLLLEHFEEPKASEYEREVLGIQDGDNPQPARRRRIFAILVMISQVNRIAKFIEKNVDDTALPLHFERIQGPGRQANRVSCKLRREDETSQRENYSSQQDNRQDERVTKDFDVWPGDTALDFDMWQPIIHVPFFQFPGDKIYFYDLRQDSILPFEDYDRHESGRYESVRKATIHSSHHNREGNSKSQKSDCFAIKKPHHCLNDFFREIEPFDKLGIEDKGNDPSHLIQLQLTFKHGRYYYLVFPWADGNLKKFWSQRTANPKDLAEVRWFMTQCSGITRALRKLHHLSTDLSDAVNAINETELILGSKKRGAHGAINPENILWFESYKRERDYLVISDFGPTQNHILGFSDTYRPPDWHLENRPITQNYDIWSLGCVFLEFLSWFLLGYEAVDVFVQARVDDSLNGDVREDTFFTFEDGLNGTPRKVILKKSVVEWIEKLHKTPQCTEPLHSFLDLIQFTMLVPNPHERWKCGWVDTKLRRLKSRCLKSDDFAMKATSRGPDPNRYPEMPEKPRIVPDDLLAQLTHQGPGFNYNEEPIFNFHPDNETNTPCNKSHAAENTSAHGFQLSSNHLPLQSAVDISMSDPSRLSFFSIELVGDRGNTLHMNWELSLLDARNPDDMYGVKRAAGLNSNIIQYEQPADQASFDPTDHTTTTRFSKDSEKIEHAGPGDVVFITDPTRDELWTDSGYASQGKTTALTSVGNLTSKQQPDESDSSRLSYDEDDTATVYSVAASVPEEDMETYKSEISQAIIKAVRPHASDSEQLEALKSPLPALLQSFALRLGCPDSSKAEKEIMYFVHKHREDIASRFDEAIRNTESEDDQTASAAAQDKAPVGWNVAQWLQGVGEGEATEQDLPHTHDIESKENPRWYPDLKDLKPSQEEGEQLSEDNEEQPSLLDQRGYRDAVFNSVAYKWLTAALVKTLTMDPVGGEDMFVKVRKEINDILGRKRTVSSRSPSERHNMAFTVEWNPTLFLHEQFPDASDTGRLLRQVLTLTGSATDAQVLPCADYLLQTWPATGSTILELLEDALVTGNEISRELEDRSLVSCLFDHSELHVKVKGTADSIAIVAEQIIWLGASLRQSCSESGLATCRPQIQISGPTAAGAPPKCHIEFSVEEHDTSSQESGDGQCWHGIFQNPVVVGGYPIPRRTQYGSGLEIPLNVMAGLTGCPRINQYMGRHFLKGFSTALVPTEKTKDAVLWHLYYSEDGNRLPYPDIEPMDKVNTGLGELTQARHIVGWCSKAQFFAGAAGMNYAIRPSRLERPGREFALEKVSFSVGQIVTGGVQFAIGRKDIHLRITRDSYWRKLSWLDQKYITLWDVDEERGWLVNGNSALLHLLRASLKHYKGNKFSSGCLFQEELFEESRRPCAIDSAGDVLSNPNNLRLKLYSREDSPNTETKDLPSGEPKTVAAFTTVKDRIEELYEILEKMIDHNATSEDSYKGIDAKMRGHDQLNGWDFADIATDRDPFHLRRAKLPLDSMSWVELTRAIPAITLFGKGFGDMIRASPPATDCCEGWEAVPTNRHLLCVSVADLRAIIEQIGDQGTNPITIAPGILWKNPFSDSPFHTTCLCATRCQAMKEKTHHCIQELVSTKSHSITAMTHSVSNKLGFPSSQSVVDLYLPEHDNGAVIFGRRAELKFSRGASATTESPTPESSQMRTLGHSSTSAGSNIIDSLSSSPPATLQPSESEGRNSAATLSAVSTGSRVLGPASTAGEAESGSQTPDSHQAAGLELNDPPNQVVEDLNPESSKPKRLSLRRKVTELLAKKWRERKSGDT